MEKEDKKKKKFKTLTVLSVLMGYISIGSFAWYGIRLIQKDNISFGSITLICCAVFLVIHTALLFMDKDDKGEKKRKKKAYKKVFKYVKTGLKIAVLAVSILAVSKTGVGTSEPMDVIMLCWLLFTVIVDLIISINLWIIRKTVGAVKGHFANKKNKNEESK